MLRFYAPLFYNHSCVEFLQLAKEHARAPFFVFQMMCCALWSFEDNFIYRFCVNFFGVLLCLFSLSLFVQHVYLDHAGVYGVHWGQPAHQQHAASPRYGGRINPCPRFPLKKMVRNREHWLASRGHRAYCSRSPSTSNFYRHKPLEEMLPYVTLAPGTVPADILLMSGTCVVNEGQFLLECCRCREIQSRLEL